MGARIAGKPVGDFLGSVAVFSSGVHEVLEKKLLRDDAGRQLSFAQFKLLKLLAQGGGLHLGDAAVFLGITPAAASKAVEKLVRRGLLVRREGHPDRRAVQLSLTRTGRSLLARYERARRRVLRRVFEEVQGAELHRSETLLDRLSIALLDHTTQPGKTCCACGIYFRDQCLLRERTQRRCFYRLPASQPGHRAGAIPSQPLTPVPGTPEATGKPDQTREETPWPKPPQP